MPIHNAGYRPWQGVRESQWTRWLTISTTGIRRALKSKLLNRALFVSLIPVFFFAIPFFLFEQAAHDPNGWGMFSGFVRGLPQSPVVQDALGEIPRNPSFEEVESTRRIVWSYLLFSLLRYSQSILMVVIVGVVAPPLISQDLRTRAYLIYFSRPISRIEYIVGKFGVISFFLVAITAVPALLLYVVAVLLSPSIQVVWNTWDLPLRVLAGSACLIIPTTLVALAYSSLTLESRYAGFAWYATWIMGHVAFLVLTAIPRFESAQQRNAYDPGWYILASPYQTLGMAQAYLFGFYKEGNAVLPSYIGLAIVSIVSLYLLFRRVAAPMRV